MDEIIKKLMEQATGNTKTLSEHYGVKNVDYSKLVKKIIINFLETENKADVIDKNFPELNAEKRLLVMAFAHASHEVKKLTGIHEF